MPTIEALDIHPPAGGHPLPLNSRARSHTRAFWLTAVLCLGPAFQVGCDGGSGNPAPASKFPAADPAAVAQIDSLREAFKPISPTSTSDKSYAWREAKRLRLLELEHGPQTLAAPALEAFKKEVSASDEWRAALLSVAAHTDRELARPLLEKLSLVYDGSTTLGVRTEALRLWCATSPATAAKLLPPILLEPHARVTYPPKEQMLRDWIVAARSVRQPVDATLSSIATDIAQPADARYVAVDELAREGQSTVACKALREVLVESGSDGMLRRKAAQAMRSALPHDEMCAILKRVSENESDPAFLYFLADLLEKNGCPQ